MIYLASSLFYYQHHYISVYYFTFLNNHFLNFLKIVDND